MVPARNEEPVIRACVESLCNQSYPDFEVIVLDDNSTDATFEILTKLQATNPWLSVIRGKEPPDGWIGKPWACHQLSKAASGEILIFTDADTVHAPDMLASTVSFRNEHSLDMFSLIPHEIMGTWSEQLILPLVHFLYFCYLPNTWILQRKEVKYSAANGQFIMFTRQAYSRIGGHETVKDNIVEDVFLAKRVKEEGMRLALADGTSFVTCRMYTSLHEVFRGFSKNFFAGMGYSLPLMILFQLHFLLLFVAPLPIALWSALHGNFSVAWFILPVVQYILATLMRLVITIRFAMPIVQAFAHPISVLFGMAIGVNAVRWAYSKHGSQWKGRSYVR
ncbi:MAG: glycosyltransferase [Candidatus Kapabacteria bacterium]|nr:glycosyltransferase [Candidatus Kapabacteria bacterium]